MVSSVQSCLVTSSTEFAEPRELGPFLESDTALATPRGGIGVPPTRILLVDDDVTAVTFDVVVWSEDVALPPEAYVLVQSKGGPEEAVQNGRLQMGTLATGQGRQLSLTWEGPMLSRLSNGCHLVKVVVARKWREFPFVPEDEHPALLVWWLVKGDPASVRMEDCPGVQPSADAGLVDAGGDS